MVAVDALFPPGEARVNVRGTFQPNTALGEDAGANKERSFTSFRMTTSRKCETTGATLL